MKAYALTVAALLGGALAAPPCPPPVTWQVPDTAKAKDIITSFRHVQNLFLPVVTMKWHVLHLKPWLWRQRLQQERVPHHPCAFH